MTRGGVVASKLGDASVNSRELGRFLRAHRDLLQPADVGLRRTGNRRTPGLRREEVAALSGVGLAWYTWLEQGRVTPSRAVLTAVCDTLRLTDTSVQHVMALAGWHEPSEVLLTLSSDTVAWGRSLVDSWECSPAVLVDGRYDMIGWNDAFRAVWCTPEQISPERRNLMWALLGEPSLMKCLVEQEAVARAILAPFRAQTARNTDDARTADLYEILQADFPDHRSWWECQGIDRLTRRTVKFDTHSGVVGMTMSALRPVEAPESTVVVCNPVDVSARRTVLELVDAAARPTSLAG